MSNLMDAIKKIQNDNYQFKTVSIFLTRMLNTDHIIQVSVRFDTTFQTPIYSVCVCVCVCVWICLSLCVNLCVCV